MKLGPNLVPLGGLAVGGAVASLPSPTWESVGGTFRAKAGIISAGDRIDAVSRETDGIGQIAFLFDTESVRTQFFVFTVQRNDLARFRVDLDGRAGYLQNHNTGASVPTPAFCAGYDMTGTTESSMQFAGVPLASGKGAYLEVRSGNFIRLFAPSLPNGTTFSSFQLQIGGSNVRLDRAGGIGNTQPYDTRARVDEPDTETVEFSTGNDNTQSNIGRSRRGIWNILRRGASGDTMPGLLVMEDINGVAWYLWVDTTGTFRFSSTDPRGVDTGGTPV